MRPPLWRDALVRLRRGSLDAGAASAGVVAGILLLCLGAAPAGAGQGSGWVADAARLAHQLDVEQQRVGATSPTLLPLLDRLAQARLCAGHVDASAALRRRALTIAIVSGGDRSPVAAAAMTALATLDIIRLRYLDAEPLLIVARAALVGPPAAHGSALAPVLTGLAKVALARGRFAEAANWARQAVAAAAVSPPAQHAAALRVEGAALAAAARFAAAGPVLRRALAIDLASQGERGAGTARSLSALANLYIRRKAYAAAQPLVEAAMQIDQARLGADHPLIADDLYDLGIVLSGRGRHAAAITAFRAVVTLLERGDEADTPRIAYAEIELARLYRLEGAADKADAATAEAHRILVAAAKEERRRERDA